MKMKIIISLISIAFIIAIYFLFFYKNDETVKYTFGEITIGELHVVISSTGTLEATSTVDVGTQVSGRITKLFADFNTEIKKGQLIALLDTTTLAAQVKDAKASLSRAKAEYKQKEIIHLKNQKLYEKEYISELDYLQSKTDVESALANLNSAQYTLERVETNLEYAFIYAPISGKVIDRSVEEGQTVAASFSAPILFTIAEDLTSMRILADVDESDIGDIKEGQKVTFTVQTYSDKTFEGIVSQIRLKSNVVSNVVSYTVVIQADNSEKLLLPGMTATIDFYIDYRENALLVPNTALRFKPSEEMIEEMKENIKSEIRNIPDSIKNKFNNRLPSITDGNMKMVYYLDSNGKLKMSPIVTGLTDGKNTEIVQGGNLKEGMKVITGTSSGDPIKGSNSLTPNQSIGPPPIM